LSEFHASYPPGSVEEAALFRHERVHAQRQFAQGDVWFARYAADASFRWQEEQLGYREEIVWLATNGRQVDPEATAAVLSGPVYDLAGRMVSFEDAYAWVQGVLASVQ
jgi:hypothetical protein